jgi:motility quorum-sensing regulator/GCU-specific mRNA interferase toxin
MEKRKPAYDLEAIKAQFREPAGYRITVTAQDFAFNVLELERDGVIELVQGITRRQFYKSMTSKRDHRIWQDVYHVAWDEMRLYVKFTKSAENWFLLISLKDKDDGDH